MLSWARDASSARPTSRPVTSPFERSSLGIHTYPYDAFFSSPVFGTVATHAPSRVAKDMTLPASIWVLQMEARYELLSQFHFGLSDELVNTTWKVRALPSQIQEEQAERAATLATDEEWFRRVLEDDLEAFAEDLEALTHEVESWCQQYFQVSRRQELRQESPTCFTTPPNPRWCKEGGINDGARSSYATVRGKPSRMKIAKPSHGHSIVSHRRTKWSGTRRRWLGSRPNAQRHGSELSSSTPTNAPSTRTRAISKRTWRSFRPSCNPTPTSGRWVFLLSKLSGLVGGMSTFYS